MDIATASASVSAFVGALQLWREIRSAQKEGREISKEIIDELGDKIRDAQDDSLAMRDQLQAYRTRAEELESENERLLDWSAEEKNRYELFRVIERFTTYRLKHEFIDDPDPVHHICPACFQEGKKSILQPSRAGRFYTIICMSCGELGSSSDHFALG